MENLINETNEHLQGIINNLQEIGREYEDKLNKNTELIESEKEKANKYKRDFAEAEAKVNKMNADIQGFENDYNHLVEKFKNDELSNILVAANREISSKIDERKKKILKDQIAMNSLVQKAESVKTKLVKLYAEKKVLEYCYQQIVDAYDYYSTELGRIIDYSNSHRDYLCECFEEQEKPEEQVTPESTVDYNDVLLDDYSDINLDSIEDVLEDDIELEEIKDVVDYSEEPVNKETKKPNNKKNKNKDKKKKKKEEDDFIYLDNLELDEEDDDTEVEIETSTDDDEDDFESVDLKEVLDATAKELDEIIDPEKDDLLSYLEISDEDLNKIISQNDDLEA